ncbi:MAG TPA: hypothetical protein VKB49_28690 [Candidatus Sulfotelmatobacter sp.]|nr:hypothetical protein [Candidatus Sulfotelmatobacter sp.]
MTRGWKILLGGTLAVCIIFVPVVLAVWWIASQTFTLTFPTEDVGPLIASVKTVASDLVVVKRKESGHNGVPAGYLVAYEQDPKGFEADAKLFDMWTTAIQISNFVLMSGPPGDWIRSSSDLKNLRADNRTDPWGHSICVLRRNDLVLVISGGPGAPSNPTCKNVQLTADELATFPKKKLLQSPAGSLVMVADRNTSINNAFAMP